MKIAQSKGRTIMPHIRRIALLLGLLLTFIFAIPVAAHSSHLTLLPQDSTQNKQDWTDYRAWYFALEAKDGTKAKESAKKYLEKFPNGAYSEFLRRWLATVYNRPDTSNRVLKTTRGNFSLWTHPTKWKLSDNKMSEVEFHLVHISDEAQAIVTSDSISMPVASLKRIVYENAKRIAPDAKIIAEETRLVNGREILCLIIESTVEGIKSTRYGYYYSGQEGTIQVETITDQSLFPCYQGALTDLLDGLAVLVPGMPSPPPPGIGFDNAWGIESGGGIGTGPGVGPGSRNNLGGNNCDATARVDTKPRALNNPRPSYTGEARNNKVEGTIRLRVLVSPEGAVKNVRFLSHLPDGLDEQAIVVARKMRFAPATRGGQPVAYWVTVEVEFNLCKDCPPPKKPN